MSHYSRNKGFTLIELLVSISILSIILTVIVLNQSTYTDGAALTNLADEISSTISQAQAYGIGVKGLSNDFSASYGVTFSLLSSGSNTAYLNFVDRNDDKIYGGDWSCPMGGASECLSRVDISRGNIIDRICAVKISGSDNCNVARVDISFTRPSTEAQIALFNSSGNPSSLQSNEKGVRVELKSPRGATRSVTVYKTGQISVQ